MSVIVCKTARCTPLADGKKISSSCVVFVNFGVFTTMAKIVDIKGREVLDSRGNPTVEADVLLDQGFIGSGCGPCGAGSGG
ncbi:hypothetical protein ACIOU6_27105, partial [Pseudomonas sp. NPDC087615]